MPASTPRARARKRQPGAALAPALCVAILLALHPVAAVAQTWAQGAQLGARPERPAVATPPPPRQAAQQRLPKLADFRQESASSEVQHVAHWAVDSGDNRGLPYLIVDKANARVFVFNARGELQGAQPALLGMGRGDGNAKGIGEQKMSAIRPEDRTTPAGRFVASLDRDLKGQSILWIDYANALALHRVVKGQPSERRAERLHSATADDNRISYGCINVPVAFFETVVDPAFTRTEGIVYILPETGTAREMFGSYDVGVDALGRTLAQP